MKLPTDLSSLETPCYLYDTSLLRTTLEAAIKASSIMNSKIHYAIKANFNDQLLKIIKDYHLGADCVSVGEIKKAMQIGFSPESIVFAGVGKRDDELQFAIEQDIFSINVESFQELEVINSIAKKLNKTAVVSLRISPEIDAHTHKKITTGLSYNKFGFLLEDALNAIYKANEYSNIQLKGLHFHIGSQITDFSPFIELCSKINTLLESIPNIPIANINVGGGLGIDYRDPDKHPIPNFTDYFSVFKKHLKLHPNCQIHFELGRSIVAQCGSLLCKVLYTKEKGNYKFIILDGGFTDLLRPAFYDAYHKIQNLSSSSNSQEKYTIAGPICESGDVFSENYLLPKTERGNLIAIRSAGAYGECMSSKYNCREVPKSILI